MNLDLREEDGRLQMNLSPNSAYIWMKEEKMPPELDLNMNDPKGDSIVSSAQASISRAMETRNEITELIRSVQLDRLVPVPGTAESSSSGAYIPPPQMHQQWLDPLGFNNAFAHQMHAVPASEPHSAAQPKTGAEIASAAAPTEGSAADDAASSHEQQKRRLETFGSNMGALGLMQQHVRNEQVAMDSNIDAGVETQVPPPQSAGSSASLKAYGGGSRSKGVEAMPQTGLRNAQQSRLKPTEMRPAMKTVSAGCGWVK